MVEVSSKDGAAGLRTFFGIMQAWSVDAGQSMTILGAPASTYYKWKADPEKARLSRDQFERLSYVFGIYKALQILLPDSVIADSWVNRENAAPLFSGHRPIELMSHGLVSDLYRVREHLASQLN